MILKYAVRLTINWILNYNDEYLLQSFKLHASSITISSKYIWHRHHHKSLLIQNEILTTYSWWQLFFLLLFYIRRHKYLISIHRVLLCITFLFPLHGHDRVIRSLLYIIVYRSLERWFVCKSYRLWNSLCLALFM